MNTPTVGPAETPAGSGAPRWPAILALLLVGGLLLQVSDQLTIGPSWLPLAIIVVLLALLGVATVRGRHELRRGFGIAAITVVTTAVLVGAVYLVRELLDNVLPAGTMLQGAVAIWVANVVTFALWYWEVDGGGPGKRRRDSHASTDFIFPQMTVSGRSANGHWAPGFFDYLFLAFNTSTAFSPTDTMILSRRAKALMMLQSLISLVTIAVLAARAINLIP